MLHINNRMSPNLSNLSPAVDQHDPWALMLCSEGILQALLPFPTHVLMLIGAISFSLSVH